MYVEGEESAEQECRARLLRCSGLVRCKWQLEKGAKGNLHNQFCLIWDEPCRRSKVFKALGMVVGEWVQPICSCKRSVIATINYVSKEETKVAGPYFFNRDGREDDPRGAWRSPPKLGGGSSRLRPKTWDEMLREKEESIDMWAEFLGLDTSVRMSHAGAKEQ